VCLHISYKSVFGAWIKLLAFNSVSYEKWTTYKFRLSLPLDKETLDDTLCPVSRVEPRVILGGKKMWTDLFYCTHRESEMADTSAAYHFIDWFGKSRVYKKYVKVFLRDRERERERETSESHNSERVPTNRQNSICSGTLQILHFALYST
jgi:hypothetical protein